MPIIQKEKGKQQPDNFSNPQFNKPYNILDHKINYFMLLRYNTINNLILMKLNTPSTLISAGKYKIKIKTEKLIKFHVIILDMRENKVKLT